MAFKTTVVQISLIILSTFLVAQEASAKIARHFIIAVDNSYSMGATIDGNSSWQKALREVKKIITKANSHDTISILSINKFPQVFLSKVSAKRIKYSQHLKNLKLSAQNVDLGKSLEVIYQQVLANRINQYLYIISDFQKNTWEKITQENNPYYKQLQYIQNRVDKIVMLNVGIEKAENLAIVQLKTEMVFSTHAQARIVATIKNFASHNYTAKIACYAGGTKSIKEVYIKPGEQYRVMFFRVFKNAGLHPVYVELLNKDDLSVDNRRYTHIDVRDKVNLLVIDGNPSSQPFEGETDYLIAALDASNGLFNIDRKTISDFTKSLRFTDYDIVIISNLSIIPWNEQIEKLKRYVEEGGKLFISLGNKVIAEHYNENLFNDSWPLLPVKITSVPDSLPENGKKYHMQIAKKHPLWQYFANHRRLIKDLNKAIVYGFCQVKIEEGVRVLAHYDDAKKHPALIEYENGEGKVVLYTTTVGRKWNDFQIGYIFPIMVNEIMQYLSIKKPLRSEAPISYKSQIPITSVRLITPEWITIPIKTNEQQKNKKYEYRFRINSQDTAIPGIYTLQFHYANLPTTTKRFVVNVPVDEGNLDSIDSSTIMALKKLKVQYLLAK